MNAMPFPSGMKFLGFELGGPSWMSLTSRIAAKLLLAVPRQASPNRAKNIALRFSGTSLKIRTALATPAKQFRMVFIVGHHKFSHILVVIYRHHHSYNNY
jgi:hypothetical protein